MPRIALRIPALAAFLTLALTYAPASLKAPEPAAAPVLALEELGRGTALIDGSWQFHLGDNAQWADPATPDATGQNGWEQLTADRPWGAQGHRSYEGYAWYRRHIAVNPAPGATPDFALLIPAIDDVYEIYWNGRRVGQLGNMPPHLVAYIDQPEQTYGLGPIRTGVLAIRVFKVPLGSNEDGISGGFEALPLLGGPEAIAAAKGNLDFRWLRSQQFNFVLSSLYFLVFAFSFLAWLRDRLRHVLIWTASYALMLFIGTPLYDLRLHYPWSFINPFRRFGLPYAKSLCGFSFYGCSGSMRCLE